MPSSVPRSYLDQLNEQVKETEPVTTISVDRYLLSAQNLINQANTYRQAGDSASVYIFLFRFANLMLYTIPKHPSCIPSAKRYVNYRKKLRDDCLPELERLKERLSKQEAQPAALQSKSSAELVPVGLSPAPQVNWQFAGAPVREPLPPHSTDTIPSNLQPPAQIQHHLPPAPPTMVMPRGPPVFEQKYSASTQMRGKHSLFESVPPATAPVVPKPAQPAPLYPTPLNVPPPPLLIDEPVIVDVPKQMPLGPQEAEVHSITPTEQPPGAALDTCSCEPPAISQSTIDQLAAPVIETPKQGFRNIHVSVEMMEAFLRVAKSNTEREIETCAILAGELRPDLNILEVNHLLVPRQKGTRDQVEMIDEEMLLGEVLSKGLMVLGWIHTHPIFQCFLSSIDVHTTLPYQLLLEEAIAIVMAPTDKKRKCGVFRLTTPGGMDMIRDCPQRGFHQHGATATGQPIYEVSSHVYYDPKLKVTVKDMR